ncbi:hypothetical protein BU17DRAFT_69236 [Hysterangium stoloniferum]|nr:hypothetical protein BU17DRAFT_69236 [Hysterangium stoloniferum]
MLSLETDSRANFSFKSAALPLELSEEAVEEWFQGERNCHDAPNNIQIRESSTNATSKISPYHRRAIDWGVGSLPDSSTSSLEISPGYYCGCWKFKLSCLKFFSGVGLERVGRTVLHNAKTAALMAKLMVYKRMVQGHDRAFKRPTYPRRIREQAQVVIGTLWDSRDIKWTTQGRLMTYLAWAFSWCPGAGWEDRDRTSTAITSSLYNAVIKSPLETNLNEVASALILQIAGYLSFPCHSRTYLLDELGYIVEHTCHRISLRLEVALNSGYNPSLTLIMDMDTTYSLWYGISDLPTFFGNSTIHTHHIKQLIVVHSLIEPLLRLILTHPSPNVNILSSGDNLIEVTLNLIAGSSDIESACSTLEALTLAAQSFLCVIATPFTGVSVLEDHGWPANSLAPSIPSDIS